MRHFKDFISSLLHLFRRQIKHLQKNLFVVYIAHNDVYSKKTIYILKMAAEKVIS